MKKATKVSENEYLIENPETDAKKKTRKDKGWNKLNNDEKLDLIALQIGLIDENGNFLN